MNTMTLAATSPHEKVFYILAPEDPAIDGVVIRSGEVFHIPFWSYVTRNPDLVPVRNVGLLDNLWSGDDSDEWVGKFLTHTIPLTEEDISSVKPLTRAIPKPTPPRNLR